MGMEMYLRILDLVKPHWKKLFLAMVCMGVVAGTTALIAYLIKPLLDEVFLAQSLTKLYFIPLLVVVVYIIKGIFYFSQGYLMAWTGISIINDLRQKALYDPPTHAVQSFFSQNSTGTLISRIINDVNIIEGAVTNVITGAIMDLFHVIRLDRGDSFTGDGCWPSLG